ncbi:hypothetical protein [Nocardia sp. NPDC052566]|uniref:hypothetical protein n=1 Tax=Nocardia sp. NPDC052566 TaxID=3364330 RepID=UPI0037CC68DE
MKSSGGQANMSTCMFLIDAGAERFVAIEARDEAAYRTHGYEAARGLGVQHPYSYGPHWFDHPALLQRHWLISRPDNTEFAEIVGGIDEDGGSWLAFHRRTGVYCRIFTEYPSYGDLPLTCAAAESAEAAVALLTERLLPALARSPKIVHPFQMLIADHGGASVVGFDGESVTIQRPVAEHPCVVGNSGIDTESTLAQSLRGPVELTPAPAGQPSTWGRWVTAFQPALHPPYSKGGNGFGDAEQIHWTKSVSIYSADRAGAELFAYNERHVINQQPMPTVVSRMGFPATPNDFFALIVRPIESLR